MANHANLTTQPTVLRRDSLPSDPDTIPVNKSLLRPAKSWPTSESKKYSQTVADNPMTYAKDSLYEHTTANSGFSF